jgi:hypothetical protein
MKLVPVALALLTLAAPVRADAHGHRCCSSGLGFSCCDSPARWAPRHDADAARLAITTRSGNVTLLLTRDVVALQLSDRKFRDLRHRLREKEDEDGDILFARVIKTTVLGTVLAVLDHSAECPIRELKDVEYRDGELVFITERGDRLLEDVDVDDTSVMQDFSARDAQAFVREFRRVKGHPS